LATFKGYREGPRQSLMRDYVGLHEWLRQAPEAEQLAAFLSEDLRTVFGKSIGVPLQAATSIQEAEQAFAPYREEFGL
jgi:hypothetical protein